MQSGNLTDEQIAALALAMDGVANQTLGLAVPSNTARDFLRNGARPSLGVLTITHA